MREPQLPPSRTLPPRWDLLLLAASCIVAGLIIAGMAFGAVETTTVQGQVLTPDGQIVTKGTISAVLSSPGSTEDAAAGRTQRVAARSSATIDPNGNISGLVLVPNDAITPSGTHYTVTFSVQAPIYASWSELWTVDTTPDPVDIGDITRLDTPSGLTDMEIKEGGTSKVKNPQVLDFDAGEFDVTPTGNTAGLALDPNMAPFWKGRWVWQAKEGVFPTIYADPNNPATWSICQGSTDPNQPCNPALGAAFLVAGIENSGIGICGELGGRCGATGMNGSRPHVFSYVQFDETLGWSNGDYDPNGVFRNGGDLLPVVTNARRLGSTNKRLLGVALSDAQLESDPNGLFQDSDFDGVRDPGELYFGGGGGALSDPTTIGNITIGTDPNGQDAIVNDPNKGALRMAAGGVYQLAFGGNGLTSVWATEFRPRTDSTTMLGSASLKWSDFHSDSATVHGAFTVGNGAGTTARISMNGDAPFATCNAGSYWIQVDSDDADMPWQVCIDGEQRGFLPPHRAKSVVWPPIATNNSSIGPLGAGRTLGGKIFLPQGLTFSNVTIRVAAAVGIGTDHGSIQIGKEDGTPILTCAGSDGLGLDWSTTGPKTYDTLNDCDGAATMTLEPGIYRIAVNCEDAAVDFYGVNASGGQTMYAGTNGGCSTGGGADSCLEGETTVDATSDNARNATNLPHVALYAD